MTYIVVSPLLFLFKYQLPSFRVDAGWLSEIFLTHRHMQLWWWCFTVVKSCPTLCDPMNCNTSDFPILHISLSFLTFMSIESVMPFNHVILCHPLLLLPSIFHSIRVFSNEPDLHIRWPKYWSFSTSPSNEYLGLISLKIGWFVLLLSKGLSRIFSSTTVQNNQFFGTQPSLWPNSHIHTWLLEKPCRWPDNTHRKKLRCHQKTTRVNQ